jgi:hypothetical protein
MNEDAEALPCSDKLGFDSLKEAKATAVTAEYQYGNKLKVYHCRHCKLWHLASLSGSDKV